MFTTAGAFTTFEEHEKGAIQPGMLADFVILEEDPRSIEPESLAGI